MVSSFRLYSLEGAVPIFADRGPRTLRCLQGKVHLPWLIKTVSWALGSSQVNGLEGRKEEGRANSPTFCLAVQFPCSGLHGVSDFCYPHSDQRWETWAFVLFTGSCLDPGRMERLLRISGCVERAWPWAEAQLPTLVYALCKGMRGFWCPITLFLLSSGNGLRASNCLGDCDRGNPGPPEG
jgi:hypothetical protein